MPKLTVVGCSSGNPHPHKACSSYLVESGRDKVLFDIGEGATSAMRRLGINPVRITAVVISHMHADHVIGLPLFVQTNYILMRTTPLTIFAPAEAIKGLKALFDLTYLYPLKVGFPIRFVPIKARARLVLGSLMVRAEANSHLQRHREIMRRLQKPNKAQCFSFAISSGSSCLVYSADVGSVEEIRGLMAGADVLIVEASHVDFAELSRLLHGRRKMRIVITHAVDVFDFAGAREELLNAEIKRVKLAREGMTLSF